MRLLNEHGEAIEADIAHHYPGFDVLDFYRGTLSARRLIVFIRQLPPTSALSRELNDGLAPWGTLEHLVADVWALFAKQDHPLRVRIQAKAKREALHRRMAAKIAKFAKRKREYGLE